MKFAKSISLLLALLHTINGELTGWIEDLIEELPDFGRTKTPHFSGYLNGTLGCDTATNGPDCQIHYWLALSESNPSADPLVLWLNGGPGSSSLLGFLQELGPLMINAKGGLMENPYAWTKYANVLAIEQPVGVGYSFCSKQTEGTTCKNTDRYTASTSRAALVDFFSRKFPDLAKNNFYITGESYAGVYIPTLTKEILDHTDINIKGIAVGDPCTDNKAQEDSMDSLWYAHKNGLVDDEIYELLWTKCDVRMPNLMTRGGLHHTIHTLNSELKDISNLKERKKRALELYHEVILNDNFKKVESYDSPECALAFRKYIMSSSKALSQSWKDLYIDDYSLFAPVSSLEDDQMSAYISRSDVRAALHVEKAPTRTWPDVDIGFDYTKEYAACNWGGGGTISMIDIYKEIVPKLERTWIYNGDTDPCVSYEGTRLAVKQIQIEEMDGGSYRSWFYNQTAADIELLAEKSALFGPNLVAQDMGAQFGGEVTDYKNGLKFVTFHGSGHMVPQFRPQAALHFLHKFVSGKELSPLLALNETLVNMTVEEFHIFRDAWTENATQCPFVELGEGSVGKDNSEDTVTSTE